MKKRTLDLSSDITFYETSFEIGLSDNEKNYWINKYINQEHIKTLPVGWKIVKSGRVKDGDMIYGFYSGWKFDELVDKEKPDTYLHYMNSNGKGSLVGYWHCVARKWP